MRLLLAPSLDGVVRPPDVPGPLVADLPPPRPELVKPVQVDPQGHVGPTRWSAAGDGWRRSSHGLYVPSHVEQTLEQRIYEAAMIIPAYGAVTGWSALAWQLARWFEGLDDRGDELRPVVLAVMHRSINDQPGIAVSAEWLPPKHLMAHDGVPITIPVRSAGWEARYARNLRRAVVALDMAAYSDLVSVVEMVLHSLEVHSRTGVPQLREALGFMDENSWSPMETLMRLIWIIDAGFPRPLCNQPVFDLSGHHIGTPDIIDLESGTVGEYAGKLHLTGSRRASDLRREGAFRRVGLEYFEVVSEDLTHTWQAVRRMEETRARAGFEAESRRRWTVVPPAWWTPTVTVDERRALTASQRDRFLRYRAA